MLRVTGACMRTLRSSSRALCSGIDKKALKSLVMKMVDDLSGVPAIQVCTGGRELCARSLQYCASAPLLDTYTLSYLSDVPSAINW